jgi:hypothetical protein
VSGIKDGSVFAQPLHHLQDVVSPHRVEAGGGFIQDEKVGVIDLGLRNPQPLAFPAREAADRPVRFVGQPYQLDGFFDPFLDFALRPFKKKRLSVKRKVSRAVMLS